MNFCEVCRKETSKRCSRCGDVYYCSVMCQKANWNKHKLVCKIDIARPKKVILSDINEKERMNIVPSDEFKKLSMSSENEGKLKPEKQPPSNILGKANANCRLGAIAGKGVGMIASRDIKRGELVLEEDPVLEYEMPDLMSNPAKELLECYRNNFQKLPSRTQSDIMTLYCNPKKQKVYKISLKESFPSDFAQNENLVKFASICDTNAFNIAELKVVKEERRQGIYLLASRINHSCLPNLEWYVKGNTIKFQAISPIAIGDELTISYGGPVVPYIRPTMKAFRSYLADKKDFDCICELCCSKDKKMCKKIEKHRVRLSKLYLEYEENCDEEWRGIRSNIQQCLRLGKDIFSEMELGKIHSAIMSKTIADECYMLAIKCKDDMMAKYFSEKEKEAALYL